MSKRNICKSKFHVCYYIYNIYENPRRKNFINSFCPKHSNVIIENKKWHKFSFLHLFVIPQEGFIFLRHQKRSVKIKKLCIFLPLFMIGMTRVKIVFVKLQTYTISISLTKEIHKTPLTPSELLTNSTIKFQEVFIKWKWHFQVTTDFFQGNCTRQYFFLSKIWTYSKSLLTGISANSTFSSLLHLMCVIALAHACTCATGLIHVKIAHATSVYDTYCLKH